MTTTTLSPAIGKALVELSTKLEAVAKSSTNPAFKSKYASIDAILASIKPTLAECGLAVSFRQVPTGDYGPGDGLPNVAVETLIIHGESGNVYSAVFCAPVSKKDIQGAGGAITYLKRYGVSALLALETENDDDGNSASATPVNSAPTGAPRPPAPRPPIAAPRA